MIPVSIAILDDFQNVTRELADWGRLPPHVSVTIFNEHFEGEELIRRISPFDVLVITRERTLFPRSVVAQLPNLKLLVTAGAGNLGIDFAACRDHAVLVCGTEAGRRAAAGVSSGALPFSAGPPRGERKKHAFWQMAN